MRFYINDVFAESRHAGNQLATFLDCSGLTKSEMQGMAREINFSESTFLMSEEERDGGYDARIFTPGAEVPFAGHPTLGTAFVIRERLLDSKAETVVLNLGVGQIPVTFERNGTLWMRQKEPEFGGVLDIDDVAASVGLSEEDIDAGWPLQEVSTGLPTIIVPLCSKEALARAMPEKEAFGRLMAGSWGQTLLLFAQGGQERGQKLSVRVFPAPGYGITEDPATGSGNGCLAAWLVKNRYLGQDRIEVAVGQGYEMRRPSTLHLRAKESKDGIDVHIGGRVIPVASGSWG